MVGTEACPLSKGQLLSCIQPPGAQRCWVQTGDEAGNKTDGRVPCPEGVPLWRGRQQEAEGRCWRCETSSGDGARKKDSRVPALGVGAG